MPTIAEGQCFDVSVCANVNTSTVSKYDERLRLLMTRFETFRSAAFQKAKLKNIIASTKKQQKGRGERIEEDQRFRTPESKAQVAPS